MSRMSQNHQSMYVDAKVEVTGDMSMPRQFTDHFDKNVRGLVASPRPVPGVDELR